MIKVAAFQAPYPNSLSIGTAIETIREQVAECEKRSIDFLCCPEAFLGGLADYADHPHRLGIDGENGELEEILSPLASRSVAVIIGFTEKAAGALLYNSAAVYLDGRVVGTYRKLRPAINHSIYTAGKELHVFEAKGLKFGIQICNDSNFPDQTARLAAGGARVLFVLSNNALPHARADVVELTRNVDISLSRDNSLYIVRADVAGTHGDFTGYGTSKIVAPNGDIMAKAIRGKSSLIYSDLVIV